MKNFTKTIGLIFVLALAASCGDATSDQPSDQPGDAVDATFGIDGKADSLGLTGEQTEAVLEIANTYSLEELDAFLNERAAENIVEARQAGEFTTLAELDEVSWVGPAALRALLDEAMIFLGEAPTEEFDARDLIEINRIGEYRNQHEIVVKGELAAAMLAQPQVGRALECGGDESSCRFNYTFGRLNNYIDRAEPGHVVTSFRSGETNSRYFGGWARSVINSEASGPVECTELPRGRCFALYGPCGDTRAYRCSIRLPE